jgi:3-hydroxybutyrate dehydrogenase
VSAQTVKSILITGAGSGIGLALAQHFCVQGHHVIATDVNGSAVEEFAAQQQAAGYAVEAIALDVASEGRVQAALEARSGPAPQVLINNAGFQHVQPLEQFPTEQWQRLVAVILTGAALTTRALLPGMRAQGYGRIVNMGSIHSLVASPYKSAYVAAKHGLLGLSKAIALETANTDITINTLCPSYVMTPLVEAQLDALAKTHHLPRERVAEEIMLKPMPKRCFITVQELTGAIEFLLSDAARNITGQAIAIDGGWSAQ